MIRVAAGILVKQGRILICQRRREGTFPLKWEFPGGKLKEDERAEEALCRELGEELAIVVSPDGIRRMTVIRHRYPEGMEVELHFFRVEAYTQEPVNRAFETLAWVTVEEIGDYDFLEADRPLVARLAAGGVPSPE